MWKKGWRGEVAWTRFDSMPIIAVEGCCHGELDSIYASVALAEERSNCKVDALLICGDFQAVRNPADLATMACPAKYRSMQSFYKYYSGEKVAPVLTIFIGGNHEASSHLCALPFGGWVAPNIFYLGHAGVINVGGVRIAGLSGIYKERDYATGHHERPPFSEDNMRSFYHVRELDVLRLLQLRRPLDIFLSHDWPQHIAHHGDVQTLVRRKSFLKAEIDDGSLGSPPAMQLLQRLQPRYWFSAHLHVKFAAVVRHPPPAAAAVGARGGGDDGACTRFLSLSKCLPDQDFLQLLSVEGNANSASSGGGGAPLLTYDAEWIAILRSTGHLHSTLPGRLPLDLGSVAAASGGRTDFSPTVDELRDVHARASAAGLPESLPVPSNFEISATPYREGDSMHAQQAPFAESNQTVAFLRTFGLDENFRTQRGATHHAPRHARAPASAPVPTPRLVLPAPVSDSLMPQAPPAAPTFPTLPVPPSQMVASTAPPPTITAASTASAGAARPPLLDEEIDLDDE